MAILRILLTCAFWGYCVPWACGDSDNKVKIRGQVIYESTNQPLHGVVVKLLRPDHSIATLVKNLGNEGIPELLGITKTDSNGNFSFETKSRGPYEIMCFRPGPHIASGNPDVDPKKFVVIQYKADPVPFSLRPGENPPKKR